MKMLKELIIVGCIAIAIIMTLYPPQIIQKFQTLMPSQGGNRLVDEQIEYRFIGDQYDVSYGFYEQTSIAFDRLALQYLIVVGVGFSVYLIFPKKDEE